jgi:hypothetical protein
MRDIRSQSRSVVKSAVVEAGAKVAALAALGRFLLLSCRQVANGTSAESSAGDGRPKFQR